MKDLLQRESLKHYPFYDRFFGNFDRLDNIGKGGSYRLKENDSHYLTLLDMPGVQRDDIEVDINENLLNVSATRKTDGESREYSSSIMLPNNVDTTAEVKAIYEDGVLKIAVPKSGKKNTKKIKLSKEDDEGFFKRLFSSDSNKEVEVDHSN